MITAKLVLEDGKVFHGASYGAVGQALGEIVFATGMTGYQETLTDPSYAGQIVVQTAPHIGNTGVNNMDEESNRIWVSGYVVREPSRIVSNYRSEKSLDEELEGNFIVGISGVDTRMLTRHIRSLGAMRAGIFSGPRAEQSPERLLEIVREADHDSPDDKSWPCCFCFTCVFRPGSSSSNQPRCRVLLKWTR